jgi:hypothetical protein
VREALSRFDLLRFIYVQKDQSDGGARKAKAKRGQPIRRSKRSESRPIGTWNASPPSTATSMDIAIVQTGSRESLHFVRAALVRVRPARSGGPEEAMNWLATLLVILTLAACAQGGPDM